EREHDRAGQQRGDHREVRVLRGRGDERDPAVLDAGQQGVLLGLREAVDLVDEQYGLAADGPQPGARLIDHLADVLDAGEHGGDLDELAVAGLGDDVGERGLAGAGRTPQDHRGRCGAGVVGGDQAAQGAAGLERVVLTDHLVEGARPHPHRERRAVVAVAVREGARGGRIAAEGEEVLVHTLRVGRSTDGARRSPARTCSPARWRSLPGWCGGAGWSVGWWAGVVPGVGWVFGPVRGSSVGRAGARWVYVEGLAGWVLLAGGGWSEWDHPVGGGAARGFGAGQFGAGR